MSSKVDSIIPSTTNASTAGGVVVSGNTIEADVVIMGVGVGPATGFLKESGFTLEKDGGIKVDEYLKVPGVQDVFAIGDIAVFPQPGSGEVKRVEHWNVS